MFCALQVNANTLSVVMFSMFFFAIFCFCKNNNIPYILQYAAAEEQ